MVKVVGSVVKVHFQLLGEIQGLRHSILRVYIMLVNTEEGLAILSIGIL